MDEAQARQLINLQKAIRPFVKSDATSLVIAYNIINSPQFVVRDAPEVMHRQLDGLSSPRGDI